MRNKQYADRTLACKICGGETVSPPLRREVDAFIQHLQTRANTLNKKKRRTRNTHAYWMARGRQQALRRVADHLCAIAATSITSYSLYLALQDYQACLEKWCIDAEEEHHTGRVNCCRPVGQWKAEGEAQELPGIAQRLSRIMQAHKPNAVRHMLSMDGRHLVSLCSGTDEPSKPRQACEHRDCAQPLQKWETVTTCRHETSRLTPVGDEHAQESVGSGIQVPALGPVPALSDEINGMQQTLLINLEEALERHPRVLVSTRDEEMDAAGLLFTFLDRVLHSTSVERVLILAGSTHLKELYQRYRSSVTQENGLPLSEHYATQYTPTVPLASATRICFASVRDMQLATRSLQAQDTVLDRQTFDVIVVYGLTQLSAPWQQVLSSFDAPYRVGFGPSSDPLIASLFDHHVITAEDNNQMFTDGACFSHQNREGTVDR